MKLYCLISFLIASPLFVFCQQTIDRKLILKRADSLVYTLKEYKELAKEGNQVEIHVRTTDSLQVTSNGPVKNLVRYELGIFDGMPCGRTPAYYAYYSIKDRKFVIVSKQPIDD